MSGDRLPPRESVEAMIGHLKKSAEEEGRPFDYREARRIAERCAQRDEHRSPRR